MEELKDKILQLYASNILYYKKLISKTLENHYLHENFAAICSIIHPKPPPTPSNPQKESSRTVPHSPQRKS
jgi:hypothetical protein